MTMPDFPTSRQAALDQLEDWLPNATAYRHRRNENVPGHPHVSRLSPALRHRLISEYEVAGRVLKAHRFSAVEKFVQEVYWRRYWKSWLAMRPQVWTEYQNQLEQQREDADSVEHALAIENGRAEIAIMAHFARELVATGYLHNHARMWFAAWWVHHERLPWQLGADFFMRHLLDGDPASNTLSWRWVAGLQTPGKTYLARKSNLEKYIDPELLEQHRGGLEKLAHPEPWDPGKVERIAPQTRELAQQKPRPEYRTGLWIHEDDLAPETAGELTRDTAPAGAIVTADRRSWKRLGYSDKRCDFLRTCLNDTHRRAIESIHRDSELDLECHDLAARLASWARDHQLTQILTLTPGIGPLHDQLHALEDDLAGAGVRLSYLPRNTDSDLTPLATGGFFGFWKKWQKQFR